MYCSSSLVSRQTSQAYICTNLITTPTCSRLRERLAAADVARVACRLDCDHGPRMRPAAQFTDDPREVQVRQDAGPDREQALEELQRAVLVDRLLARSRESGEIRRLARRPRGQLAGRRAVHDGAHAVGVRDCLERHWRLGRRLPGFVEEAFEAADEL